MKMNMRKLLLVSMLGAGLLPMIGTTIFIKNEARDEIKRQAFSSLEMRRSGSRSSSMSLQTPTNTTVRSSKPCAESW